MNNLSICLRLKVSIKSSVLGKHWRALNFKTENYKTLYFFSLQLFDKVTLHTKNINIYNYFLVVGIVKNKINKTHYEHPIYFLLSYNVRITRKITRWHKAQIAYRLL